MSHLLVGGSARCGKSTLSREIRRSADVFPISGDALRETLRKKVAMGLFPILQAPKSEKIPDENDFIVHHTVNVAAEIAAKRAQAEFVWPFLEQYARQIEHESGGSALIESIDVWPDHVAASGLAHRAVFLVNTSAPSQAERIITSRGKDPYDWMHQNNYSDGRIRAWSEFNAKRSQMIRSMAEAEGYLCVDLAETSFEEGQSLARAYLLESEAIS